MATKIRAKRESGLTAVRLKRDPPVYLTTASPLAYAIFQKTKMVIKQIKYRNFNKANMTEMVEDMNLYSIILDSENLEELVSEFRSCVAKSLEKHAPMKLSKIPFRDS